MVKPYFCKNYSKCLWDLVENIEVVLYHSILLSVCEHDSSVTSHTYRQYLSLSSHCKKKHNFLSAFVAYEEASIIVSHCTWTSSAPHEKVWTLKYVTVSLKSGNEGSPRAFNIHQAGQSETTPGCFLWRWILYLSQWFPRQPRYHPWHK